MSQDIFQQTYLKILNDLSQENVIQQKIGWKEALLGTTAGLAPFAGLYSVSPEVNTNQTQQHRIVQSKTNKPKYQVFKAQQKKYDLPSQEKMIMNIDQKDQYIQNYKKIQSVARVIYSQTSSIATPQERELVAQVIKNRIRKTGFWKMPGCL